MADTNFDNNNIFSTGIYTRDISARSTVPNSDYEPIFEAQNEKIFFAPNEESKTVKIRIVDDTFFEMPEGFQVVLKSDVTPRLSVPNVATVTIRSDDSKYELVTKPKCFTKSLHAVSMTERKFLLLWARI